MLDEPRAQSGGRDGGVFYAVGRGHGVPVFEGRLDGLEEGDRERVSFVEVRDVDVKAAFLGVGVGEEAQVGEGVAEDFWRRGKEVSYGERILTAKEKSERGKRGECVEGIGGRGQRTV